jgi:hypothetical protein
MPMISSLSPRTPPLNPPLIISPYFDGLRKMNGPYPEITNISLLVPSIFEKPQNYVHPSAMHISNLALIKRMKVLKNNLANNDIFVISGHGPFIFLSPSKYGLITAYRCSDKLVLILFPGIPTSDPAIAAFYDKRIYKKLRLKELSLSDPLYHG